MDVSIPGRLATSLDVSPPDDKDVDQATNMDNEIILKMYKKPNITLFPIYLIYLRGSVQHFPVTSKSPTVYVGLSSVQGMLRFAEVVTVSQIKALRQMATSRKVAKRPKVRKVQVANPSVNEASKVVAKRPGISITVPKHRQRGKSMIALESRALAKLHALHLLQLRGSSRWFQESSDCGSVCLSYWRSYLYTDATRRYR